MAGLKCLLENHGLHGDFVEIDGIRVHFVEKGMGSPLVLLHGFNSCLYTWRYNILQLSKHFRVIAIDLPGFGLSERPPMFSYSLTEFARLMDRYFEKMGLDRVWLMGHSFGGAVCQEFARRYKDRTDGIILAASSVPGKSVPSKKVLDNLLLFTYFDKGFITPEIIEFFRLIKTRPSCNLGESLRVESCSMGNSANGMKFKMPCLIVWGENDMILGPEIANEVKKLFFNARIHRIPECGHAPHEEKYFEFNEIVLRFLLGD